MQEASTEILVERSTEPEGLSRSLVASVCAHTLLIAVIVFIPGGLLTGTGVEQSPEVMTLRLGGPEGPSDGGIAPLGGQPIQEVVSLPEARRPQWVQPPSPAPPEMILPVTPEESLRRPEPKSEVSTVPEEARGRRTTTGPEAVEGSAMADTGVRGVGIGLSTGGLGGNSTEISLADFCCPDYLATMQQLIRRRWNNNQSIPGSVVVRFTIQRSGTIDSVEVDRSSGYVALDLAAQRAILLTRQIQPLPSRFTEAYLTIRLTFEYRQ